MRLKIGFLMDPIESIHIEKDTTFAMMLEAQKRDHPIFYLQQRDLYLLNGRVYARVRQLKVEDNADHWCDYLAENEMALDELDVVLMRKDPPFDIEYVYTTHLLELAEAKGVKIINKPQSLRDANEKLFANWFPQCCPETLVTRDALRIREFIRAYHEVVIKPLGGMGGAQIFRLAEGDPNITVVIELLTHQGQHYVVVQRFLPEIAQGDKRIILINGEPVPYALARIPARGEVRANLAAGGTGMGVELTKRDRWLCEQVGKTLRDKGLLFVGLDVIGDFITEINVTSPTCVRQIDAWFGINLCGELFDCLEMRLQIK